VPVRHVRNVAQNPADSTASARAGVTARRRHQLQGRFVRLVKIVRGDECGSSAQPMTAPVVVGSMERAMKGDPVMSFETESPITIRFIHRNERRALDRLAELEGRDVPDAPFVVAEVDEQIVAAVATEGDAATLADPFLQTAQIVSLLEIQARGLRGRRRKPLAARLRLAA